jgi:hypothetical protein
MKPILKTLITKNQLSEMIAEGKTLQDVVDYVEETTGFRYSTGAASKLARKYKIDMPRSGPRSGDKHKGWKGGKIVNASGYVEIYCPDHPNRRKHSPYVLEHRLVMEQKLGRFLSPKEVVHHKNGDKTDNRPSNLEVFASNKEHLAATLKGCAPNWTENGKEKMKAAHVGVKRKMFRLSDEKREAARLRARTMNAIQKVLQLRVPPNKKLLDHYLESHHITFREACDMVSRHVQLPAD